MTLAPWIALSFCLALHFLDEKFENSSKWAPVMGRYCAKGDVLRHRFDLLPSR